MNRQQALHAALVRWEEDGGVQRRAARAKRRCVACGSALDVRPLGDDRDVGFCRDCRAQAHRPVADAELGGEGGE